MRPLLQPQLFTSCKKDRTCTCTITDVTNTTVSGPGIPTSTTSDTDTDTETTIYTKARKGDAKSGCVSYKQNYTNGYKSGNYTYSVVTDETGDCKLK